MTAVEPTFATIRVGSYHAMLTPTDFAWTGKKLPSQLLKVGDLVVVSIKEVAGSTLHVQLEQQPVAQAALLAIDNPTGEVKAMVGGYDFDQSKFNRATQAVRQTGSSFKVYVYATALEQGASPFDTIVDEPVTFRSGGQNYSPKNYDLKFEGRITLRRALADSRNVPAVRLIEHVGVQNTIDMARRFGITSPLPPYLPLALGSADLTLMEHTSAFTVFPDDGIHIEPHYIRRVTSYDGAVLEEPRPNVKDVVQPDVARTMTAMLEEVVQFGTGVRAKELGRVSAGKTGTTNDFTDAWYIGFTPHITAGVWVGNDDKRISLGKKETGARAALPIWLEFMQQAVRSVPGTGFSECGAAREGSGRTSGEGGYAGYGAASRCRRAGVDADAGFAAGEDTRRAVVSVDASRRECHRKAVRENFGTQAELALAFLTATNKLKNQKVDSKVRKRCSNSHCCRARSLDCRNAAQSEVGFSAPRESCEQAAFEREKSSGAAHRLGPGRNACSSPVRTSFFRSA